MLLSLTGVRGKHEISIITHSEDMIHSSISYNILMPMGTGEHI